MLIKHAVGNKNELVIERVYVMFQSVTIGYVEQKRFRTNAAGVR
jgi:hypothetical protein